MRNCDLPTNLLSSHSRETLKLCGDVIVETWSPSTLHTFPGVIALRREATDVASKINGMSYENDDLTTICALRDSLAKNFRKVRNEYAVFFAEGLHQKIDMTNLSLEEALRDSKWIAQNILTEHDPIVVSFSRVNCSPGYHDDGITVTLNSTNGRSGRCSIDAVEFIYYRGFLGEYRTAISRSLSDLCVPTVNERHLHETGFYETHFTVGEFSTPKAWNVLDRILRAIYENPRTPRVRRDD
jgi:hypothetical protein